MRRTLRALALATLIAIAAWPWSPPRAANAAAARRPSAVLTDFRPSRDGFRFRNPRPDPSKTALQRLFSGRCGGMTYGAIDAFSAGRHPRGSADSPEILERSADSIVANFARFALWSVWPDVGRGAPASLRRTGVGSLTRAEELPRLAEGLEHGPVALGLVRARSLAEIGLNHQVVAYAMETRRESAIVWVYDSCQPGNDDVRLVVDLTRPEAPIVESASGWRVASWRGAFVESYVPVASPRASR